jgi:hypothetical protein
MITAMADEGLHASWRRCLRQIRQAAALRVCPCTRTTRLASAFGQPGGRPLASCTLCHGTGLTI